MMARLELTEGTVFVALSRRNLLALLSKLDWPESARTIVNSDCYRDGRPVDDVVLVLRAEDDDEHYARRADPPGLMHPVTEVFIRAHDRRRPGRQIRGCDGAREGRGSDEGANGSAEAGRR
jgi:AMMECR1 domain-containing protein